MLNKFLLLGSGSRRVAITGEPYRVGWNIPNQFSSQNLFLHMTGEPDYSAKVDCAFLLSDYDDQPKIPAIHVNNVLPFTNTKFDRPALFSSNLDNALPLMKVKNIKDIADVNRVGKEPKIFSMRCSLAGNFGFVMLLKYSLNAAGTTFFGIRSFLDENDDIQGHLVYVEDGGNPVAVSSLFSMGGPFQSMIRLVVYPDKIEARIDEPGLLVGTLPIPAGLKCGPGAYLGIIDNYLLSANETYEFGLSDLIIYDGTF